MESGRTISINRYLMYENDKSRLLEMIYILDKELKRIHMQGYYVDGLNSGTIIYNEDGTFSFTNIMRNSFDKDINIRRNILDFAKLSLGVYVFASLPQTNFNDYTKLKDEYVYENFKALKEFIPIGSDYYESVIVDERYTYYSDFVDRLRNTNSATMGNSSSHTKVYSTPAGKLYSGEDNNSGFSSVAFYFIITIMFVLFSVASYVLFITIRG